MEKTLIANTLKLVAGIILENGGEAYRVEDSVERLGRALGLTDTQVYSVPGSVIMTLSFEDGDSMTQVVRCKKRIVHLDKVDRANRICREVAGGILSPSEALEKLTALRKSADAHPVLVSLLSSALAGGSFAIVFGGTALDAFLAASTSAVVRLVVMLLKVRDGREQVISNILGGALSTLLPALIASALGQTVSAAAAAGAIMHLVPGVAMACAVQDFLKGDITSGLGYSVNALLIAVYVAGGAMAAGKLLLLL